MVTVSGILTTILNESDLPSATVEVALCGYGSQVPRLNGQALAARVTDGNVVVNNVGYFQFQVVPNDDIEPAGTYYTVTIKDDNGDIVQVNAYIFDSGTGTYDLNTIDPYDPNQPPPPLAPALADWFVVVPFSANPMFDLSQGLAFKYTLTGDSIGHIENGVPGNLYTFFIVQDSVGGHNFTWPEACHNATPINMDIFGVTIQTFVCDAIQELWAIGAGTYYL